MTLSIAARGLMRTYPKRTATDIPPFVDPGINVGGGTDVAFLNNVNYSAAEAEVFEDYIKITTFLAPEGQGTCCSANMRAALQVLDGLIRIHQQTNVGLPISNEDAASRLLNHADNMGVIDHLIALNASLPAVEILANFSGTVHDIPENAGVLGGQAFYAVLMENRPQAGDALTAAVNGVVFPFNDKGANNQGHGVFTHRIQWWAISYHATQNAHWLTNTPRQLYWLLGHPKLNRFNAQNPGRTMWIHCFDKDDADILGARSPETLSTWIRGAGNVAMPDLKIAIETSFIKSLWDDFV